MNFLTGITLAVSLASTSLAADGIRERVALDAAVVERIGEVGGKDLPFGILEKIVLADIDLLRGQQSDGTYTFAHYERAEAGRETDGFSVASHAKDELDKGSVKARFAYRAVVEIPNRRMLVRRNQRVFIDRLELDYVPLGSTRRQLETIRIGEWLEPGGRKTLDLPKIAREASATLYAKVEGEGQKASVELTLLKAKLIDNSDSPWFEAVQSAKSLLAAIEKRDENGVLRKAATLRSNLSSGAATIGRTTSSAATSGSEMTVTDRSASRGLESTPAVELYLELQIIEDLLTGSESEKRDGLDKLHQMVRRLRPGV